MASEYQLNLKAVLDSTQVQQELNKLRQSTSQALGGENARSNAQAPSGNLTSLGSTLNNLNQTLNRLNQTLGQLRGTAAAPSRTSAGGPIPVPFGGGQANQRIFSESLQQYGKMMKAMSRLNPTERLVVKLAYGIDPLKAPYELLFGTSAGSVKNAKNLMSKVMDLDPKVLDFRRHLASSWIQSQGINNYFRPTFVDSEYQNMLAQQKADRKNVGGPNNINRMMHLFGGQYLAGELGNLGASIGGRTGAIISGGTDAAQSGLMTGLSMSMMGANPAYAAAAGIAVAAAKISSVMLEYAQKISQAAERSYALLSRSKQQIGEQYKNADDVRFSKSLAVKDPVQLKHLQGYYESEVETSYDMYQSRVAMQNAALETARQNYLDDLAKADKDERYNIENEYANEVARIVTSVKNAKERWDNATQRLSEINATLEAVKSEYKDRRSYSYYLDRRGAEGYSDTDVANRSGKWSLRASRIQKELDAEIAKNDMSEEGMRRRRQLQSMYGEYQSEADFWEKQSKSRESAREDIQKNILAQERIREIEALTKKYDFSKGYSSDENRRDILKDFEGSRSDIGGQYMQSQRNVFGLQQQMMQALKEASSEGISAEDRAAKLKEASTLDEQIQNEKNRMNVLGAAYTSLGGLKVEELQDALSRLQAPSKDRATSLAQYGYNMGEKGDDEQRWQSELQYLKDQKQIQDDIKNILNDKLPSPATFA